MRANQAVYPVATMCRLLPVPVSGYYAWLARAPAARSRFDQALLQRIEAIHQRSRGTYGAPRIHGKGGNAMPNWRKRVFMWAKSAWRG